MLCKLDCAVRSPVSPFRLAGKEKNKAKATQYMGDDALVRILDGIRRLLPHPGDKDPSPLDLGPHPSLASMLLTSALPEVLGNLFAVPFEEWNTRKAVYASALALIRSICESPAAMPMLVNPLVKKATNGLRAFVESRGKVIWAHHDPSETEPDPKTVVPPANNTAPAPTPGIAAVKPLSKILVDVFNSAVDKMAEFEALPEDDVTDAVLETMATLDGVLEVGEQFVASIKAYQTVVLARLNAPAAAAPAATEAEGLASAAAAVESIVADTAGSTAADPSATILDASAAPATDAVPDVRSKDGIVDVQAIDVDGTTGDIDGDSVKTPNPPVPIGEDDVDGEAML